MTLPLERNQAWSQFGIGRADIAIALLLGLVAIAARLPFVFASQMILHHDEATVGLMAQDILAGRHFPIYFYGQRYMGALEAYVAAALLPLFDNPSVALRMAPTLFLSVLVGCQHLLVTRWFGRMAGVFAALAFIAASPLIAHWTISARGGYIEIMLWGTLLWWSYSEWFVRQTQASVRQMAVFGFLVGSGLWLNATIVAFLLPIVLHVLYRQPLAALRGVERLKPTWNRLDRFAGRWYLALPVCIAIVAAVVSSLMHVQVTDGEVTYQLFFGLLSGFPLAVVAAIGAGVCVWWLAKQTSIASIIRQRLQNYSPIVLGAFVGYLPAIAYVVICSLSQEPVADSIPLGFRPFWTVDQTAEFAYHGLPAYFAADPRLLLDLIPLDQYSFGFREIPAAVTDTLQQVTTAIGLVLVLLGLLLIWRNRHEFAALLRLEPTSVSPIGFLGLALLGFVLLYLFSGCSFDVLSVRYMIPMWVAVSALIGAIASTGKRIRFRRCAVAFVLTGWVLGQCHLLALLGQTHPLQRVAGQVEDANERFAKISPGKSRRIVAEHYDAKLLSFLTEQQVRVVEYKPFWPRLQHFSDQPQTSPLTTYFVGTERDQLPQRFRQWPGKNPPYSNQLAQDLRDFAHAHPQQVLSRKKLLGGFELWTTLVPIQQADRLDVDIVTLNDYLPTKPPKMVLVEDR